MDKSVAILNRTNRGLRPFEDALSEAGVKYYLVGRSGFWSQPEIRAVVSILGCVLYPADHYLMGAVSSPFWPTKFLPKTKILSRLKEIRGEQPKESAISHWQMLTTRPESVVESKNLGALREFTQFVHSLSRYRDLRAVDGLKSVMATLKVGDYFSEIEETPDSSPLDNLQELLRLSEKWTNIREFMDYTRRASAASKGRKGVALSTIHGFKGMESDIVFLVGCQEGQMPHSKSTDLPEERNLFFVGCSRPKQGLYITYTGVPSQFLKKEPS
jgi:DNA helicase-2/ATP-dependent DNA helicase PcrA